MLRKWKMKKMNNNTMKRKKCRSYLNLRNTKSRLKLMNSMLTLHNLIKQLESYQNHLSSNQFNQQKNVSVKSIPHTWQRINSNWSNHLQSNRKSLNQTMTTQNVMKSPWEILTRCLKILKWIRNEVWVQYMKNHVFQPSWCHFATMIQTKRYLMRDQHQNLKIRNYSESISKVKV